MYTVNSLWVKAASTYINVGYVEMVVWEFTVGVNVCNPG